MFRTVKNWITPKRKPASRITHRDLPRTSNSANEDESDESSMSRRGPYERRRNTRRGVASSTQSQDNVTHLAEIEMRRESERFIDGLVIELTESKEKNGRVMAELEESRRRIHDQDDALVARAQDVAALKDVQDGLVQSNQKRLKDLRHKAGKIKQLEQSIVALTQTTSHLTSEKTALEDDNKQQALRINQLQHETETQISHITELTGAIVHSSTITTSSRDDDYYAGEFARLSGAIRQWVLRYFEPLGAPELTYRDLSEILQQSLAETVLAYSSTIAPDAEIKIGRKEIEAGIARRLIEHIFNPSFLLVVFNWPCVSPAEFPTVSDREIQKWRSQTASILIQHSGFEFHFAAAITDVTEDLGNSFTSHVKPEIEASRVKALRAIVEQAARLEIEISRELSMFEIPYIAPGSRYEMELLDDRSGVVDRDGDETGSKDGEEEEEEEDTQADEKKEAESRREFIVDTVLFPPVMRWEFDDQGKVTGTPIIIRKGVVTAIRS